MKVLNLCCIGLLCVAYCYISNSRLNVFERAVDSQVTIVYRCHHDVCARQSMQLKPFHSQRMICCGYEIRWSMMADTLRRLFTFVIKFSFRRYSPFSGDRPTSSSARALVEHVWSFPSVSLVTRPYCCCCYSLTKSQASSQAAVHTSHRS